MVSDTESQHDHRLGLTNAIDADIERLGQAFALMVPESKLETTESGLAPKGGGWYVLNMRDAEWRHVDGRGAVCVVADDFEGWRREADQLGVNPFVLMPGEPMAMYHWEADQEAFLVVSGEATLIIEGDERQLRAWDSCTARHIRNT